MVRCRRCGREVRRRASKIARLGTFDPADGTYLCKDCFNENGLFVGALAAPSPEDYWDFATWLDAVLSGPRRTIAAFLRCTRLSHSSLAQLRNGRTTPVPSTIRRVADCTSTDANALWALASWALPIRRTKGPKLAVPDRPWNELQVKCTAWMHQHK